MLVCLLNSQITLTHNHDKETLVAWYDLEMADSFNQFDFLLTQWITNKNYSTHLTETILKPEFLQSSLVIFMFTDLSNTTLSIVLTGKQLTSKKKSLVRLFLTHLIGTVGWYYCLQMGNDLGRHSIVNT